MLDRARRIERLCRRHDVSVEPAAALSFVLAHPDVTVVIVGMATPDEVDENIETASVRRARGPVDRAGRKSSLVVTTTTEEGSE